MLAAQYGRSSSFTKGEIDAFWNKQKLSEQAHFEAALRLAEEIQHTEVETIKDDDNKSVDVSDDSISSSSSVVDEELERSNSFKDWWTKSNWAFLNEPAIQRMESADRNYAAQLNVTTVSAPQSEGN
ncbi:hypothetical protein KP509_16G047200 [Ceratopteris richardii]|uniref:Uncharacterized protein n=1 Tax=Ceratopteris richardii TaxID=49495 RepID=A0A8T2SYJ9_CERRI|nr:hypothetical protein KP509_16G047200 [Ceratopteris richardii]